MTERNTQADPGNAALADALNVSFRVLRYVMLLLLVAYVFSGCFIVHQDEKALVLVFGKLSGLGSERIKGPGAHWTFPRPLAEIVRVPTERVQAVESRTFWYEVLDPSKPAPPASPQSGLRPGKDGYSLTGDANLIHSQWVMRYRVANPEAYALHFKDVDGLLARELDHAVVRVAGTMPIDQALRTDIEAFRAAVAKGATQRIEQLGVGVQVVAVEIVDLAPPRQAIDAFNDVVAAENERSQRISAARAAAARTLNEAGGQASKLVAEGEAYKRRLVSEVSADADYFSKVQVQYAKNPEIIARTLLEDTLRRVLTEVEAKYILPNPGKGEHQEIRLQLSPEQKSPWKDVPIK